MPLTGEMMSGLSLEDMQRNAIRFSNFWKGRGREKQEDQEFVRGFFDVFGLKIDMDAGGFQYLVGIDYMDFLWRGKIGIEMKTVGKGGKDLEKAFEQLEEYISFLPDKDRPELWLACDFENMLLYSQPKNKKWKFKTNELKKKIPLFETLLGITTERMYEDQIIVNVKAAEMMAKLHDEMKSCGYEGEDLEIYLVRLLFCLFAEDTEIFPKDSLLYYVQDSDYDKLADRLARLFIVLDTPYDVRAKKTLWTEELTQFNYVNGELFKKPLKPADFNKKMKTTLLDCARFDWSKISPAIFGAMFQGVMDDKKRREIGAHYTSEENILKLIKPLFLDGLWNEFDRIGYNDKDLNQFHEKIASLKFLDPACGCGNFLIITYRELRKLELAILRRKHSRKQQKLDISYLFKVSIEQFYGIECEEFPCQIAQVGMWLIEHQMNQVAEAEFGDCPKNLPLIQKANIIHGNALRIGWENIVPKKELSYILGNPPFIGYSNQSKEQKEDIMSVYLDDSGKPYKNAGKIDYVAAWYYKASKYILGTRIRAAFVSTNSITQGEQVATVWKPLFDMFNIRIDFAHRTFKWGNEARGKAAVHCVIVGFSVINVTNRIIFDNDKEIMAKNINPYLYDAQDVFIESRNKPICDIPEMNTGNRPADGGHLIIEGNEYDSFIKKEPGAKQYIRKLVGSDDYIKNKNRYCLWLVNVPASELRKMPEIMKRIAACKDDRENAPDEGRRKLSDTPALFREILNPDAFLLIPRHSSENRRYIPIGFLDGQYIPHDSALIIPNATLYHFGILTSSIHMAWVGAVCGRLEMRYRYSKDIVYNNFPWPCVTDEQRTMIENLAQAVLDARRLFPQNSLADLYDPLTTPPELLRAHQNLDRAVMKLYDFSKDSTEPDIVADLMKRYQELTKNEGKRKNKH